ncbi:murein hydrolase activator EnvC [Algimonas porphyrae]|uniref:murein hydrolase activator EnvC family protein n=1 Tax=Algimonas porphyrae TaxID=1128113 RepID=UPI00352A46AB
MRIISSCLAIMVLSLSPSAWAQQTDDLNTLSEAEAEARAKEAALQSDRTAVTQEIASLKTALQRDTEQTQAFESRRLQLLTDMTEIEQQLADIETELADNRMQTQVLLASLQRLQLAPNVATLIDPDDAVRTAQAATMIDLLSRRLRSRAEAAKALSLRLRDRRDAAALQQAEIDANASELTRRRERTQALVAQKESLRQSIETEAEAARAEAVRLAAESATLRDLLERVSRAAKSVTPRLKPGLDDVPMPLDLPPGTRRFADAKGGVVKPVSGRMTTAFGGSERGETYSAPSGGQVLAPYAGRVEFSGPFKTYGRVVILNMDDGYYLLLTGLGQTYVEANETVRRGEPVGQMPRTGERAPLYMELRRNGRPINPAPWIGGRG